MSKVEKEGRDRGWDNPDIAIDNYEFLKKKVPEFAELQNELTSASRDVMKEVGRVAPTEMSKAILFLAMQALPKGPYVEFLDQTAEAVELGAIRRQFLKWAIFPQDRRVRTVLQDNYKSPDVQRFLSRAKSIFADEPQMIRYCDSVLSGQSKADDDAFLAKFQPNGEGPSATPTSKPLSPSAAVQNYLRFISESKTKGFLEAKTSETIYKWTADVKGDGRRVILLTLKDFYKTDRHNGQMPQWSVYIPKADGSGYLNARNDEPQIDQEKAYVGQISELNQRGIVTVQVDRPRNGPAVACIYAYTIEGDHLKQTKLAEYDPDRGNNAIYDQYLTEAKRAHIALEEITP